MDELKAVVIAIFGLALLIFSVAAPVAYYNARALDQEVEMAKIGYEQKRDGWGSPRWVRPAEERK